ncbi:DUF2470 domain-containing protein [Streptomyces sp. NPDC005438]|uniref:DUF2470 domain-containing protein n=1 Tax=Streptomyces sp. NPDC005438 TaxID=3156880 RepID=UPI0033B9BB65
MGSVTSWTALRLEVGETCVDDLWGTETVEPEDFTVAAPDPLAQHETELLQHLASSHDSHLRTLSRLLGDERQSLCALHDVELDESLAHDACWSAVPLALDRFGMRVRFVTGGSAVFDARFEFPDPVRDVAELRLAMRRLFDAAEA